LANAIKAENPNLKIILTDYFPNIKAFENLQKEAPEVFGFESKSVNVMDLPTNLYGNFRAMFGAFHHYRPNDAKKILQNAVDTQSPIAIFEPLSRNFASYFSMLFIIFNVLIFTLFIRPVRWNVLPFIYIVPIIPLYILWDGVVNVFRKRVARVSGFII
jgi:hypothetical protein